MDIFVVTGPKAEFHPGARLGLSPEQLAPRARALKVLGPVSGARDKSQMVEVLARIEFKRGERLGIENFDAFGKAAMQYLAPLGSPQAEQTLAARGERQRTAAGRTAEQRAAVAADERERAMRSRVGRKPPPAKPAGLAEADKAPKPDAAALV